MLRNESNTSSLTGFSAFRSRVTIGFVMSASGTGFGYMAHRKPFLGERSSGERASSARATYAASSQLTPFTGNSSRPSAYVLSSQVAGPGRPVASRKRDLASTHDVASLSSANAPAQYSGMS